MSNKQNMIISNHPTNYSLSIYFFTYSQRISRRSS